MTDGKLSGGDSGLFVDYAEDGWATAASVCGESGSLQAVSEGHPLLEGRLFDEGDAFRKYVDDLKKEMGEKYHPTRCRKRNWRRRELIIDNRLAKAGKYRVGEKILFLGREFTICGIVEAGRRDGCSHRLRW